MAKKAPTVEERFSPFDKSTILSVMTASASAEIENKDASTPQKVGSESHTQLPASSIRVNRLDVAKTVLLSQQESAALELLATQLATSLRTFLKTSHGLRRGTGGAR